MSLPSLINTTDFHAPTQSGENAKHDDRGNPQSQLAPTSDTAAPTVKSTRQRFAEFEAQWASLARVSQPLHEGSKPAPLPQRAPIQLQSSNQLQVVAVPMTASTNTGLKQGENSPRSPIASEPTVSKPSATPNIQSAKQASPSQRAPQQKIMQHEPCVTREEKTPAKSSGTQAKRITEASKQHKKEERKHLAKAIDSLDLDGVTQVIQSNYELIYELDADGRTALGHAASLGSTAMVSHLLALESRVDDYRRRILPLVGLWDASGRAPIHNAIDAHHYEIIDLLLTAGTPIDLHSAHYKYPLLVYAALKNEAVVASVLRYLPEKMLDKKSIKGFAAVHVAVIKNKPSVLKLLIEAGCRTDSLTNKGNSALHLSAIHDSPSCTKVLLQSATLEEINATNNSGDTALHLAATKGNIETVRLLIEAGATIDLPNHHGWTALANATNKGHLEIMKLLMEKGADALFGTKGMAWPVTIALESGDQNKIKLFHDSSEKLRTRYGLSVAAAAASWGNSALLEASLRESNLTGGNIGRTNMTKLLNAAIRGGNPKIMELLCDTFEELLQRRSLIYSDPISLAAKKAIASGKIDLVLPLAQGFKRLDLDSESFLKLLSYTDARSDYALLDAISKSKLVVDGIRLAEIPEDLLSGPLLREIAKQPKPLKPSLATMFRRPKVQATPSIDATSIASQLALDLTSIDPRTAIESTLSSQQVSGVLHEPLAASLIPLISAFSTAGNLKLSQAQYIVSFGLAQYADPDILTLPDELSRLSDAETLLKKYHAHREALAEAGEVMLDNAEKRINDDFLTNLAEISLKTPVTTTNDRESAIADKLANQFGLLPIWAKCMGKVCVAALSAMNSTFRRSFNTDQPSAEQLALLTSSIVQKFAEARQSAVAPEGFAETALQLSPTEYQYFDALLWRQWDKITGAMAAHSNRRRQMDSADTSTNSDTDGTSDSALSTTHSTNPTED